jgi:hypothetical protein
MNRPISENDPFIVGTMAAMRRAARPEGRSLQTKTAETDT